MFPTPTYINRRTVLKEQMTSGLILIMGNRYSPMNYKDNVYHFRQDSNFLYYFGLDVPALAGVIDVDKSKEIIVGEELTIDDIIWTGPQPSLGELAERVGVPSISGFDELERMLKGAKIDGRTIHFLPPYRHDNQIDLSEWLGIPIARLQERASKSLIRSVIRQRSYKTEEEIAEMEKAVNISGNMHVKAMSLAKAGMTEAQLTGAIQEVAISAGGDLAYPAILTVNGHILHNHYHGNELKEGQMVLGDFGAENQLHYAGDITRTFPVSARFTSRQREIYEIVLRAEEESIRALAPGVAYQKIHLDAATIIARGLKDLGIMQGDVDEAVAAGAHALFFPHGLGHMIGLDVHDMEDLGENLVGYNDEIERSTQFGLNALRLGRKLEPGFVLTVEPGIYFIPELMDLWEKEKKFEGFINYRRLADYRDFSGIRIEDNVLITEAGYRVLGQRIPKSIAEIEEIKAMAKR